MRETEGWLACVLMLFSKVRLLVAAGDVPDCPWSNVQILDGLCHCMKRARERSHAKSLTRRKDLGRSAIRPGLEAPRERVQLVAHPFVRLGPMRNMKCGISAKSQAGCKLCEIVQAQGWVALGVYKVRHEPTIEQRPLSQLGLRSHLATHRRLQRVPPDPSPVVHSPSFFVCRHRVVGWQKNRFRRTTLHTRSVVH